MLKRQNRLSLDHQRAEDEIIRFIRDIVSEAGSSGVVVGLSGGIDSAVVGALCVRALGREKVVGVLMPASHTPADDTRDARAMAKKWGIEVYEVGIDPIFDAFVKCMPEFNGENRVPNANVKARIRMVINYFVANSRNMLVAGTGDKSEELIGFFTKFGDGGADFLPIAHLYKTQVRELGASLGIPSRVVSKPSSPQLWPGHKAVDEIPLAYEELDPVLSGLFDEKLSPAQVSKRMGVDIKTIREVLRRHRTSAHKRVYPPMLGLR